MNLVVARLLYLSPLLLAWTVIVIVAIATWRRNPRPSLLVLLGGLIFLINVASGIGFAAWQQSQIGSGNMRASDMALVFSILNIAQSVISTCSLAMLGAAAFVGRSASQATAEHGAGPHSPQPFFVPPPRQ